MLIKRRDTKTGRYYEIDGELYPSVTTILQVIAKPFLLPWAVKLERELCLTVADQVYAESLQGAAIDGDFSDAVRGRLGSMRAHQKEMDRACDIGTRVHAMIEASLKGDRVPGDNGDGPASMAFRSWRQWADSVDLKPLAVEQAVYSKRYGYAGTMDTLAELTDERTGERMTVLADWKSSKSIYREYKLQNAAYSVAWAEMHGRVDAPRGLIVRLPKSDDDPLLQADRPLELKWIENPVELFQVFRRAHDVWKWQNNKK